MSVRHRSSDRPAFKTHQKAHEAVLANEAWFGNGAPEIGKQFTKARAKERKAEIIDLLFRAAKRDRRAGDANKADQLEILADKLHDCRSGRRCGSLACPECHRAFQKAKVAAETVVIKQLKANKNGKKLVMVTVVPLHLAVKPDQLAAVDVNKLNRWLKDNLTRADFRRIILGSIDISWEADRGIYQIHWHLAMWTADRQKLTKRLKVIFPANQRGDRPSHVAKAYDLNFLAYKNKAIKFPALLRNNRRHLGHLLLILDQTEALELMVLFRMRLSAQSDGLKFSKIAPKRR